MTSDQALVALLRLLKVRGYAFVTPTPRTHRIVLARPEPARPSLRDVFGWSRPFAADDVDADVLRLMEAGDILETRGERLASTLRVSSLGTDLFLHSAFPPSQEDAVFFGPDTYRYAALLAAELDPGTRGRLVDIGAGAGAGGLAAARIAPGAKIVLADVNTSALRLARLNAEAAGVEAELVESDGLDGVTGPIEVAIANPPFIAGSGGRTYRDGGDMLGARLSLDWARAAAKRLTPGGRLILYTGSAIVDGHDAFRQALAEAMTKEGCKLSYRELDPDIFGATLGREAYRQVERIAAIGAVAVKGG